MSTRGRLPTVLPSTPEWLALAEALDVTPSPCKRMPEWTSDDADDRAVAARACAGCQVLELCHAAAESTDEQHGVWAGIDRTRKQREKRTA